MPSDLTDVEALKAANQRFYAAFGALDLAQLEAACDTSERALCVHPGWPPIAGWSRIRQSWERIFDHATLMHFNIHYVALVVEGDCGWVNCIENITSVVQGRAENFGVVATNIFTRTPQGWKLIAHHGSPQM